MYNEVYRNMSLSGKSKSTFDNYIKSIAKIALHFNKTLLELSDDEINDYLLQLKEKEPLLIFYQSRNVKPFLKHLTY
ncbi:phage integrase N-terminal SAM-like domain-containing protein [Flammeovirga sp. OC4]|uniref:phage integrase N-terminal SAM-like domain-containing protein n=1 Tax=Flammeovirga sp. OC4 TaxID=1382345 RepID=UPI0005C75C93